MHYELCIIGEDFCNCLNVILYVACSQQDEDIEIFFAYALHHIFLVDEFFLDTWTQVVVNQLAGHPGMGASRAG